MEIVSALRWAGGKPRAIQRIVEAFRRPPAARGSDRNGGLPRPSDVVAHDLRCTASRHRPRLAENHGKPSPWVSVTETWYKATGTCPEGPKARFLRGVFEIHHTFQDSRPTNIPMPGFQRRRGPWVRPEAKNAKPKLDQSGDHRNTAIIPDNRA